MSEIRVKVEHGWFSRYSYGFDPPDHNVEVWITSDVDNQKLVAKTTTDVLGEAVFDLAPGTYYWWARSVLTSWRNQWWCRWLWALRFHHQGQRFSVPQAL